MKPEEFHRHLPGLLNGDLSEDDSRAMEQALTEREEYRQSRFVAEVMRETMKDLSDEQLLEHPSARYMLRYSEDPAAVPEHVRESIELHVSTCGVCAEVLEHLSTDEPGGSVARFEPRARHGRSSPLRWVFHPALAALYLIGFVGLSVWMILQPRPDGSPIRQVAPAPQLVFADPLYRSSDDDAEPLLIDARGISSGRLHLLVQTDNPDLAPSGSTILLALLDENGSERASIEIPASSVNAHGTLSVIVDASSLERGKTYELRLSVGTEPVFSRTMRLDD